MGTLGEALRQYRVARGWSLREMASRTPYQHVYLWDVEGGRRTPTAENVVAFCEALGIRPHEMLSKWEEERVADIARQAHRAIQSARETAARHAR